ncbi:MAG: ABC transporter substrate-binding protein [Cyanobacteria bacterium P01_B01_bin.77]
MMGVWKYGQTGVNIKLLALGLLTAISLSSCQRSDHADISRLSESSDCRTVEHKVGETEICGNPQKIVALGPYVLEHLLALNIQPVGYADHIEFHQGDYSNPSQQIPYLGDFITQPLANVGLAYTPSIESILQIQPDLILGVEGNNAAQ